MLNKEEISSKMPTFEQIKTCLYDRRHKRFPALPTEQAQVHFSGELLKTASGELRCFWRRQNSCIWNRHQYKYTL